ncbi:MAG TPA: alpha/beta fold hydrolase [Reyranella sp.]|nr:alpha/beta fold hydrolase [Reyranella sp.]
MKQATVLIVLLLAALGFAGAPAQAQDRIGVIFLHGKQGSPQKTQGLGVITSSLESAGAKVVTPTMAWSGGGWDNINLTVEQVFAQLDAQAASLRSQGAGRIVVGGHSLGAAVALAYAVARGNLAGLVMVGPGHQPAGAYRSNASIHAAVDRARALVEQGRGNDSFSGPDSNQGTTFTVSTTAAAYYSWMNPDGLASMHVQAPRLPATTPLLLVIGRKDPFFERAESLVYRPAAKNPYSKYVVVDADHVQTPFAAAKQISDWIVGLPR